jgi:putative SOS response-associated peptidase YedK
MVFAGIWDTWTPKEGDVVESCCIVTTQANSFVEAIHNRMPVILNSEQWTIWLSQQAHSPDKLLPLTYSQVVKSM